MLDLDYVFIPECFNDHEEFVFWKAQYRLSGEKLENLWCADCTLEYSEKMKSCGKCHPIGKGFKREGKTCAKCGKHESETVFRETDVSYCQECRREYMRNMRAKQREEKKLSAEQTLLEANNVIVGEGKAEWLDVLNSELASVPEGLTPWYARDNAADRSGNHSASV